MPLKTPKSKEYKLPYWIIHTHRPFYRIMKVEQDPETKELLDTKKSGGLMALEKHPLAHHLSKKFVAAESLEHSKEREDAMEWALADERGDFTLEDGHEAEVVWNMVKNDPDPKPTLDPRSPEFPKAKKAEPVAK